jgi:RNA polymerase sigma-70 factor (ECF subfamily)
MSEPSDLDLLRAVAGGDRGAFEALYERHAPIVMRFLHHLCHDAGLAEDLTQETFVRAWRAAGRFRPEASVRTWLLEIAKRRGWSATGRRARRAPVWGARLPDEPQRRGGETPSHAGTPAPSPPEALVQRDEAERVREALLHLPPKLRLVFVLVRLEGCSFPEAAEVAGIPVGTVKSRMAAAEAQLRQRLARSASGKGRDA